LTLIPFSRTAKPHHYGPEGRVLVRSPGECGIATRQEHQVIEIGTCETQRSVGFHSKEAALTNLFATLRTRRISDDAKHDNLIRSRDLARGGRPRKLRLHNHRETGGLIRPAFQLSSAGALAALGLNQYRLKLMFRVGNFLPHSIISTRYDFGYHVGAVSIIVF
jgi:hypothetical protein